MFDTFCEFINVNSSIFYEKHDVNTPPFMAGMKRHPLKKIENQLDFSHGK
jgi:hypothetical protein